MNNEPTRAKVQLTDGLGPANEVQPLVERLRARLAGSICNADGTYTIGNCPPDALSQEAADEIERLQEREAFILNVTRDAQQIAGLCGAELMKLRADDARIRVAGGLLSNVAYNLAQKPGRALTSDDVAMLDKMRRQWDEALKA